MKKWEDPSEDVNPTGSDDRGRAPRQPPGGNPCEMWIPPTIEFVSFADTNSGFGFGTADLGIYT